MTATACQALLHSDPPAAKKCFEAILQKEPNNLNALIGLADYYLCFEQPSLAGPYIERAMSIDQQSIDTIGMYAKFKLVLGELTECEKWLKTGERKYPNSESVLYCYARLYQQREDARMAEIYFRKLITHYPNHYIGLTQLGIVIGNNGNHKEAETLFLKSLSLCPSSETYLCLAQINRVHEKSEVAFKYLQMGYQLDPDDVNINYELAGYYYQKKQFHKASQLYMTVLSTQPSFTDARTAYIDCLLYSKQTAKAITDCNDLIRDHSQDEKVINYAVQFFTDVEDFNRALELGKQLLKMTPNPDSYMYNNMGLVYVKTGQFPAAIEHFETAIHINKNNPAAYINLSNLYIREGRRKEAEKTLHQGIYNNEKETQLHENLGVLLLNEFRLNEAFKHFSRSLELNPNGHFAYKSLGDFYRMSNKFVLAEQHYKKSIEVNPDYLDTYLALVMLYEQIHKINLAKEVSLQCEIISPQSYEAYMCKGIVSYIEGRHADSLPSFLEANKFTDQVSGLAAYYLSKLPVEVNPECNFHFNQWRFQNGNGLRKKPFFLYALKRAKSLNACFLIDRLCQKIPDDVLDSLFVEKEELNSFLKAAEPFKKLIAIWKQLPNRGWQSFLGEAIITFHLGDAVEAYILLRNAIVEKKVKPNTMTMYYCLLLSKTVGQQVVYLNELARHIAESITHHPNPTKRDIYYSASVFQLLGEEKKAYELFTTLSASFKFANYRMLELLRYGNKQPVVSEQAVAHHLKLETLLRELTDDNTYLLGHKPISAPTDPAEFLNSISNFLYYKEVEPVINELFDRKEELPLYLETVISFGESTRTTPTIVQKSYRRIYIEVITRELENVDLAAEINGLIGHGSRAAIVLARRIENEVNAEIRKTERKEAEKRRFLIKDYLIINHTLLKRKVIDSKQAEQLFLYMLYCLEKIPDPITRELLAFIQEDVILSQIEDNAGDMLNDIFDLSELLNMKWGFILKIGKLMRTLLYEKRADILSYETFVNLTSSSSK